MRDRPDPRFGSVVGTAGGLAFVLVNAGALPGSIVWRVVGVLAAVVVLALLVSRPPPSTTEPRPRALRVYLVSVAAMVVAIPAGAAALGAFDHGDLVLPWVVAVVGAHFVPFAGAFGSPVFRVLGFVLVLLGAIGAALSLAGLDEAAPASGVAAGFALLAAAATPYVARPG